VTDNLRKITTRRSVTLEARHVEAPRETLDRLRLEVAELQASRKRLALAADADRRTIERDLHDGPQQHLVALAANLELTRRLADTDSDAAKRLLEEMGRDVHRALDKMGRLAHRIYPPLLEAGGLAVALRTAAATVGIPTRIEVEAGPECPPEVAGTVYFCCLEVLERADEGARARVMVMVRDDEEALVFEVVADDAGPAATASSEILSRLRDRVEALGGQLTVRSEPGDRIGVSGSVPLSR
jgi:signal transduction histidine kinase